MSLKEKFKYNIKENLYCTKTENAKNHLKNKAPEKIKTFKKLVHLRYLKKMDI